MRTFVALELSDAVRAELERLQGKLGQVDADVKWVAPRNIHLTLKFLGDVEEGRIDEIKNALTRISSGEKAFEISLFRPGAFPGLDRPRVLWVGIDKGCAQVEKIASSAEEELEKIGFPKEKRPMSAHLTLGRVKSGKNKDALKEKILSLEVRPVTSQINHITLFQSTLTPKGPIYSVLHKATLI
ncbi:MAG: RNA 2',3'-cyclic phosphodiesterase [Omnitrophica bacterium]|nr:RNA 2',3'-cyclic phosphodiesterase [Candidatus Omnitrophota bacterium]